MSRDVVHASSDLLFAFFGYFLCLVINRHTKCEVSNFIHSRDRPIEGSQNVKVGHVT